MRKEVNSFSRSWQRNSVCALDNLIIIYAQYAGKENIPRMGHSLRRKELDSLHVILITRYPLFILLIISSNNIIV